MRLFGKFLLFIIAIAVVIGMWIVFMETPTSNTSAKPKSANVIKNEKEIAKRVMAYEPKYYADDYGTARIYGSVKNISKQTCDYIKLEIEERDEAQKPVRTITVMVKDIPPNGIKSFDTNGGIFSEGMYLESKAIEAGFSK